MWLFGIDGYEDFGQYLIITFLFWPITDIIYFIITPTQTASSPLEHIQQQDGFFF